MRGTRLYRAGGSVARGAGPAAPRPAEVHLRRRARQGVRHPRAIWQYVGTCARGFVVRLRLFVRLFVGHARGLAGLRVPAATGPRRRDSGQGRCGGRSFGVADSGGSVAVAASCSPQPGRSRSFPVLLLTAAGVSAHDLQARARSDCARSGFEPTGRKETSEIGRGLLSSWFRLVRRAGIRCPPRVDICAGPLNCKFRA